MMKLLLTVEDTFLINARGLIVVPAPRIHEVRGPGDLEVELVLPDGQRRKATLTLLHEFLFPTPAIRRWGCVFRSLAKADVPIGTEVWYDEVEVEIRAGIRDALGSLSAVAEAAIRRELAVPIDLGPCERLQFEACPDFFGVKLVQTSEEIMRYCGNGIPCLVLVDEKGKVLSDTNRGGDYVGPQVVLDDTRKLLQKYRQKNPRQKT